VTLPNSLLSYGDCMDFFERIADDPRGGRVEIGTYKEAHHFRLRCNQARRLHRRENAKIHAPDTKMHGASEYDEFMLKLKEDTNGSWWVYAERMSLKPGQVELLSELDGGYEDGN
jgi:hypothetical protein